MGRTQYAAKIDGKICKQSFNRGLKRKKKEVTPNKRKFFAFCILYYIQTGVINADLATELSRVVVILS